MSEFNSERPHDALGMKCPAAIYSASPRPYGGLPEFTYPLHDRDLLVTAASAIVWTAASMHYAVEGAARCYSVNTSQCGSATATQSYAQAIYHGMSSPTFTASAPACGRQVNATLSVVLGAGAMDHTVERNGVFSSDNMTLLVRRPGACVTRRP